MSTCAWCGKPATSSVVLEPAEYRSVNGAKTCVKFEVTAPACGAHSDRIVLGLTAGPEIVTPARRGGRHPKRDQLTIYTDLGRA